MQDGCTFRSAQWSSTLGIDRRCFISAGRAASIQIGRDSGFSGTVIAASKKIRIGDRVLCGANCTISDSDWHPLSAADRASGIAPEAAAIEIEDDVFLGMNGLVLKGVRIGSGTVVGANSVVTRSLPQNVVAGGTPARPIKSISAPRSVIDDKQYRLRESSATPGEYIGIRGKTSGVHFPVTENQKGDSL